MGKGIGTGIGIGKGGDREGRGIVDRIGIGIDG